MSGGESANDTGGVKEMEATHDTRTTEKGHDLDVALSRSNAELARLLPRLANGPAPATPRCSARGNR